MNGPPSSSRHLARLVFVAFLLTFIVSRTLVILIMIRRVPDLFLHLGGTHVHHLNYGIFLLSTIAAVLLFGKVNDAQRAACAVVYGIGMALTFDEFGMWLHLGGSYWQRASFDAVVVLLGNFRVDWIHAEVATPSDSPFRYHGRFISRRDFILPAAFQIAQPC